MRQLLQNTTFITNCDSKEYIEKVQQVQKRMDV